MENKFQKHVNMEFLLHLEGRSAWRAAQRVLRAPEQTDAAFEPFPTSRERISHGEASGRALGEPRCPVLELTELSAALCA